MVRCFLVLWAITGRAAAAAFECHSDIKLGPVRESDRKGIALDDTTFWNCSARIPHLWPHSRDKIKSLRLFKAWDPRWPEGLREDVWKNVIRFTKDNGAKVLIGSQITCNHTDDEQSWNWTKELLRGLGPESVMGLAIGNEMELLYTKAGVDKTVTVDCINDLWQGRGFFKRFQKFVEEFDSMGFDEVPLTSVFGGVALTAYPGFPFFNEPRAMVSTFFSEAHAAYGDRFVFTFNIYPYFDPNQELDAGHPHHCRDAIGRCSCWNSTCNVPRTLAVCRQKIRELTGKDRKLWVGETGWSSPIASSLNTRMVDCEQWSANETFRDFYGGFLNWSFELGHEHGKAIEPPDHAFYFSPRDSVNFGVDWENEWSEKKKQYCCLHLAGCPTPRAPAPATSRPYECLLDDGGDSDAEAWSEDEKEWCCSNEAVGCATKTTTPEPFDCVQSKQDWETAWSHEHKRWCCNHKGLACEGADKGFDCQHWLAIWRDGWTEKKKEWCCAHENLGCPNSVVDGEGTTAPEEFRVSFRQLVADYPLFVSFLAGCAALFVALAVAFGCMRAMAKIRGSYRSLDGEIGVE